MPLKMALAAGWSSFAYDVQQLMRPPVIARSASAVSQALLPSSQSPLHQSHLHAVLPALPASLESQQLPEVPPLLVPLIVFRDFLLLQNRAQLRVPQALDSASFSSPNPPSSSSQLKTRLLQELPSSSGISRAFQLRNYSDALVSAPAKSFPPLSHAVIHAPLRCRCPDSSRRSGR